MREHRIFQNQALEVGDTIALDENGSRHIGTVLRGKPGDLITVFNNKGGEFKGDIIDVSKKSVMVKLKEWNDASRASFVRTHLGQVMSRGDRMDYALQKAVELGVSEITPLFSQRCEVKLSSQREEKRLKQWEHLIISACEQCGLNQLPILNAAITFEEWAAQVSAQQKWILHPGHTSQHQLFQRDKPESIALAVGPEGGFNEQELGMALANNFTSITFGPRVFRTETAPVVCLSLIQSYWGDF